MGFVFYNEAFLHHGVLFIEPNLYVATLEFLMIVVGAPLMGFLLAALIFGGNGSARNEPDEDAMPAPGEAPKRLWN